MKTGQSVADRQHIPAFDGVRAISILLVLATHLLPLGPTQWALNHAAGLAGMSLFFALSGFLITYFLWYDQRIDVFLLRRFARIYPLLIFYALIVSLVIYDRPDTLFAILTTSLNYSDQQIFKGVSHLWSICIELHFYFGIALIVGIFGRKGFIAIPVLALVVLILRVDAGATSNIRTHLRIDEIFSGSILAIYWVKRDKLEWVKFEIISVKLFPLIVFLWLASCHPSGGSMMYLRPYFAAVLLFSIALMPKNAFIRMLTSPAARYLAKISYALYIWHPLMALGALSGGGTAIKYLLKRPITFLLSFGFAHLTTHTFEAYFIHISKSYGVSTKVNPK